MTYTMKVAGLERELPLCKVSDDLYIGAFIMFGDAEIRAFRNGANGILHSPEILHPT